MAMGEEKEGETVYGYIFSSHNKMTFEAKIISWLVEWKKRTKRKKKKTEAKQRKQISFIFHAMFRYNIRNRSVDARGKGTTK